MQHIWAENGTRTDHVCFSTMDYCHRAPPSIIDPLQKQTSILNDRISITYFDVRTIHRERILANQPNHHGCYRIDWIVVDLRKESDGDRWRLLFVRFWSLTVNATEFSAVQSTIIVSISTIEFASIAAFSVVDSTIMVAIESRHFAWGWSWNKSCKNKFDNLQWNVREKPLVI